MEGHRLLVCVRERMAGRHSPSNVPLREGLSLDDLAGQLAAWPLQWQMVLLEGETAELRAGHWGTAPLFLHEDEDTLRGHWDAAALLLHVRRSRLHAGHAARWIVEYATPYATQTLFEDLMLLPERTVFRWSGGKGRDRRHRFIAPQPWPRPAVGRLKEGADAVDALGRILQASTRRWAAIAGDGFAREVSGGLDSCLVSAVLSGRQDIAPRSYGLALMGTPAAERDQLERRNEIVSRFGLVDQAVRMHDHLPLAPGSGRLTGRLPVLPWEEGYHEAMDALLRLASRDGTHVMSTGFGGDELFGLRPSERVAAGLPADPGGNDERFAALFLTSRAREMLTAPERLPRGACSASAMEAAAFSAARYIRRGIWPVHPLCTPELVHFCARLPPELRRGRNLQRQFLARAGISERVTRPLERDDFSPAMAQSMRGEAAPLLDRLFRAPALADLGIVDGARLRQAYAAWRESGPNAGATVFYATAALELALA